jgi:UDP-N-acetylglucosamine transferase subunit ALG13
VILALLGTHPAPMHALVVALDQLIATGAISEDVVVQAATTGAVARGARQIGVIPYQDLQSLIRSASVVISHAGPATLADVRQAGKVPVVVPRRPERGEHVDDHQVRYAARLAGTPGYVVVGDLSELGAAIERARRSPAHSAAADVSRAVRALEAVLGEPRATRRARSPQ